MLFGNPLGDWVAGLAVGLVTFVLLGIVLPFIVGRVGRRLPGDAGRLVPRLTQHAKLVFLFFIATYAGSLVLELREPVNDLLRVLAVFAFLLQVLFWGIEGITFWVEDYREEHADDPAALTSIGAVGLMAKAALWSVLLLIALDNMGIEVTALVAGLGIGGIAIALAAQNILGDLFASLSIVLDKPVVVGDFVALGTETGTVERVGLKTTRVRSLTGEQLVFSNNDLLQSRIRNYGRMYERRGLFTLGVEYDTPIELVEAIPDIMREAIENQETTRFDRAHFARYADAWLEFEGVYYMLDPDYYLFMDTQQAINLHILREFRARGIEFAFPTQTLHVLRGGSNGASTAPAATAGSNEETRGPAR
ncbi:MAG: mechanosensitive ion channel [Dehalococcoidia bacterium]|nr:mechanosensitive ion channel [Dehalococcoidia bacterium]